MSKNKNMSWLDLIFQQLKMDIASFCLLKKIYQIHKEQFHLPVSKDDLAANSPEYTHSELEECLSKLSANAYLDISDENISITDKGIFYIEGSRKMKCINIIVEIIISILVIGFFVKRIL